MSKKVLFTLHELPFVEDTLYEVGRKKDTRASQEFIDEGTSKILSNAVADMYPNAGWDGTRGVWDTGLEINSKALIEAEPDEEQRKKIVKILQEKVIKPLEKDLGEEALSNKADNTFWDEFNTTIYLEKTFNTASPREFLELYSQVIQRRLTPKANESHPDFKFSSQFCVINKEQSVDRKMKEKMDKAKANAKFVNLVEAKDDVALNAVFHWLGLGSTKNVDEQTLYMQFDMFLENDSTKQNVQAFIKAYDDYQDDTLAEEMLIHVKLKQLDSLSKLKRKRSEIYLEHKDGGQTYLGTNLKEAAKKIASDEDLTQELGNLTK